MNSLLLNYLLLNIFLFLILLSFGIIVQEIISRQGVFYLGTNNEKTPKGNDLKVFKHILAINLTSFLFFQLQKSFNLFVVVTRRIRFDRLRKIIKIRVQTLIV